MARLGLEQFHLVGKSRQYAYLFRDVLGKVVNFFRLHSVVKQLKNGVGDVALDGAQIAIIVLRR